jgi:hypothetical protein
MSSEPKNPKTDNYGCQVGHRKPPDTEFMNHKDTGGDNAWRNQDLEL